MGSHPCARAGSRAGLPGLPGLPRELPARPELPGELREAEIRVDLHEPVLAWFDAHARDLPWRRPDATPWGVFVSEVMSQQTPLARVEPAWLRWMQRWPTPAALAQDSPGEAVRMWDRLGYPRRALRLHEAATAMVRDHGGRVPDTVETLLTLPGVGAYTAAAVAAFAYGRHSVVVDTNVRRVQARAVSGRALPAKALTAAESALARRLVPGSARRAEQPEQPGRPDQVDPPERTGPAALAARWNVAIMELGALVCTARAPRCGQCPIESTCAWRAAGCPPDDGPPRRGQAWAGTDRQVRGALMAVLRAATGPVPRKQVLAAWPQDEQRARRCLHGLLEDGLAEPVDDDRVALPA